MNAGSKMTTKKRGREVKGNKIGCRMSFAKHRYKRFEHCLSDLNKSKNNNRELFLFVSFWITQSKTSRKRMKTAVILEYKKSLQEFNYNSIK